MGYMGDIGSCSEEGGDPFDGSSLVPGSSLPEIVRGSVVEEVLGPLVF